MNVFHERVMGRFGDVEREFVIKSALVEVPVISLMR